MSDFMMDRGQEYVANEFVVATAHRDLVMNELTGTGATAGRPDPDLELVLVTLPDPEAAARQLRAAGEGSATDAKALPLDTVLTELRTLFAGRYGGWQPTLGKNRVMKGVQFFPYPSFGGDDMPTVPAERVTFEPSTAHDRDAGHRARVVVLDTGIYPLDTLAGRYLAGTSSVLQSHDDARPWWQGHATFVSGLILGRAPAAELEIRSILEDEGRADVWRVAQSLVRYADSGADVLTAAFGCFTVDGRPPLVLERAIARLTPKVVVVAAAGNYGAGPGKYDADPDALPQPKTPIWPAAFESVVAVGAADANGETAPFSPRVPWVDLVAPGVQVTSDYLEGDVRVVLTDEDTGEKREELRTFQGQALWSGTSFAAAAVSGAVAAQTIRGRRTAYEALDRVRRGIGGASRHGIDVATYS
jgi:subtilisin family serine protease